jgi:hypothetical protein
LHKAEAFYGEYLLNPASSDNKYKGKLVEIENPRHEHSDRNSDVIRLWVQSQGNIVLGIRCCFDGPAEWPTGGESTRFIGVCAGLDNDVIVLKRCWIAGVGGWVE